MLALLFAALACAPAMGADVTLLCAGAMKDVISTMLARRDPSQPRVAVTFATAGGIRDRLANGERPDVVIAPSVDIAILVAQKRADGASRKTLGQTEVGVAAKVGAPRPDISTPDALRTTLLAARKVAIADPAKGTSGRTIEALFRELRIDDAMRAKTLKVDGGSVAETVARGEADLGLEQVSEILPVAGVQLVGPLPRELRRTSRYDVAAMSDTPHRNEAEALIRDFGTRDAQALIEKSGFTNAP